MQSWSKRQCHAQEGLQQDQLLNTHTNMMCLQLADQSVRYLAGITENILVKIQNFFILVDFVVLDM
jgi:hypothetical protein